MSAEPLQPQMTDTVLENRLRPRVFDEFPGQFRAKENLQLYIAAAKKRAEPLDHILLSGPPGLGKTTLAGIIAAELGAEIKITSGPALERPADLAGLLTGLKQGDVLFIDEIHRLGSVVEEYLYSAMEDWAIDVVMETGLYAKSIHLSLQRFTLIGATTREGLLTAPFRARFGIVERLEYYQPPELFAILQRSARLLNVALDADGGHELACRARGTPRIANRFLARARDVAEVKGNGTITRAVAQASLDMMQVDAHGLTHLDRRILQTLFDHSGRAVGLKTLAITVGETEDTLENVYEPFLIQQGLILKTPQGRRLAPSGYRYLGHEPAAEPNAKLF